MRMRVTFTVTEEHLGPVMSKLLGRVDDLDITNAVAVKTAALANGTDKRLKADEILLPLVNRRGVTSLELVAAYQRAGGTKGAGYAAVTALRKKRLIVKGKDDKYRPGGAS